MRARISMVALFTVSLAAACGYDPHLKGGGLGDGGGGSVGLDGSIVDLNAVRSEAGAIEAGVGEASGGTGLDGGGASGSDGAVAAGGMEAGGEASGPYDVALDKPADFSVVASDGGNDASAGGAAGTGGAGGAGGMAGSGGIVGTGGASGPDAPLAGGAGGAGGITGTGGGTAQDAPIATGGSGGGISTGGTATGGTSGTGGIVGTGGITGTGGTGTGGTMGTGGSGTGGTTASCTDACTAGATQCFSGTTLQTCALGGNGCTAFSNSTCSTGLVCERYPPADCLDPNWDEWPIPNSQADVTAGAPNLEGYTDNGDGTVTDNVTGLMWQKTVSASDPTYTWASAATRCPTLALGGHNDWRLPARIELVSIVDFGQQSNAAINGTYFPSTPSSVFWSSSPVTGSPSSAWVVSFADGATSEQVVSLHANVRCVR